MQQYVANLTPWLLTELHRKPLARVHWDGSMNFLDFFLPKPLSSADRSRCFLWFMHHYLEGPDVPNPFGDDFSRMHPDHAPRIRQLSPREAARENVDTEDEIVWGNQMSYQRNLFLRKLVSSMDGDKKGKATPHFVPGSCLLLPACSCARRCLHVRK